MKIVVIGGTGRIGSQVVRLLDGHEAVAAAPSTGVNALTGEGLSEVLRGVDVLVDVSNSPSFADDDVMDFFQRSTGNLVRAAREAGVRQFVALSVVGADELPDSGYLRAKVAQEKLIQASGLPYTIVRATQFLEFADAIADTSTVDGVVRLSDGGAQPIAAEDVAVAVARAAGEPPVGGIVEIGGPEVLPMDEWIRRVLTAREDPREVVTDPEAKYFGAVLGKESLVPAEGAGRGKIGLTEWLNS
ncbi:SDR family oxidoreductase [Amycolatopsis orientalis]|uniref:SDR family oxidoreductase n=1 Tax=Amycolatopsis orientalis TaxID=31958 RepID=UPI0003AA74FC|nr:SDR family oxidoreductase [Amycolatopsis orientalis]